MKCKFLLLFFIVLSSESYGQSLQECIQMAEQNYPLIRKYNLIDQTSSLTVSSIQKDWLPQVTASAQATLQSDVTAWPDEMRTMLASSGLDVKGLKKDQYRIGIDLVQTVYDGGIIQARKDIALLEAETDKAQTTVDLYAVRQRVIELYFSALLIEEQTNMQKNLLDYLKANESKLESMHQNGTASLSDFNTVRAERLDVEQQIENLLSQAATCKTLLSMLCGQEVSNTEKPQYADVVGTGRRPELDYIDSFIRLLDAKERLINSSLLPKVSVFATGFYGYPGYNMFEDMIHHKWSLNGMIGMRFTWNIGSLYTVKSDRAKIHQQISMAENNRDVFLFNNRIEQIQRHSNIERFQRIMKLDDEIISLRSSIRKASESKLDHGIIEVSELVKDLKNENNAMLQKSIHEIEYLKELAKLNFTTNNK